MLLDERVLADIVCLDPVPAHGVLGLVNLGSDFLEVFYRWFPLCVENGVLVREKRASFVIIRPRDSVTPGGRYSRILDAQGHPMARSESARQLALAH